MRKIEVYLILFVILSAWAMWYQSSRAAMALCEADLATCEAEYFASLDR